MGKGHRPFPLPKTSPAIPPPLAPHPRTPYHRVSQPPPSPRSPPFLQQLEARDSENGTLSSTSRLGRGARPKPGAGRPKSFSLGRPGSRAVGVYEALGKEPLLQPGPELLERPLRSRGASFSRTSIPSPGQASELTDAGLSGPYSPGPPYFPALNLGRPGARGTSPGPRRVPGARADAGAFLSAGPSYMRRAGPPGEQRGPSPRRAGPGGPRGGTGRPYSPGAPSPQDRLLRPTQQLPAVWTSQVFPGSELQEALC